jgi:hypothetical protein
MTFAKQNSDLERHPLGFLPIEDLDLITELVLRSGSLKDLATAYGVTYRGEATRSAGRAVGQSGRAG